MKPLYILIGTFIVAFIVSNSCKTQCDYKLAGRIALSAMLLFTSLGHFMFTDGMSKMIPDCIPFSRTIIYITGVAEIIAAICLFVPGLREITGIFLFAFFILILPTNIYAAIKHLNYETGEYNGYGIIYLWFRIPFQMILLWWTYYFVLN